ncbi:ATP-binding protein [Tateyamaria sp. SN3-11]|uniref:HD domain-containing protein n=1 Tax=Tateyamaria sp. SN3-11 TaxID=3092147 RepID=UPI0039EC9A98
MYAKLSIPVKLKEKLHEAEEVAFAAKGIVKEFENWFGTFIQTDFFHGYTDHSISHVNRVLANAELVISEACWQNTTSKDICCLLVAALLHDSAMLLSKGCFVTLLASTEPVASNENSHANTWSDLWNDFTFALKHDLYAGADVPSSYRSRVSRDPTAPDFEWTTDDTAVAAEFIRQHHHELALDFARHGLPGENGRVTLRKQEDSLVDQLLENAGMVALSHGCPIRETVDKLALYDRGHESFGVHFAFVCAVLRISDYMDIGYKRAPLFWQKLRKIDDLEAVAEWQLNQASVQFRRSGSDPETIEFLFAPASPSQHYRFEKFIENFQRELDETWAVLGETYGSKGHLNQSQFALSGLTFRRAVMSSLGFMHSGGLAAKFINRPAQITVDDSRIVQLLVRPLYQGNQVFGLRELIQNSVDAVNTRRSICPKFDESCKGSSVDQPEVKVTITGDADHNIKILEVRDNGVGMNERSVRDFFFRVGSSSRFSEEWKKTFNPGEGPSHLVRTGYFGIGILAAFLIGSKITVRTRHFESNRGLCFSFKHGDKSVDLNYCDGLDVGTTVTIEREDNSTPTESLDTFLLSPTYFGGSPVVGMKAKVHAHDEDDAAAPLSHSFLLPKQNEENPQNWVSGNCEGFGRFHVGSHGNPNPISQVFINGFTVEKVVPSLTFRSKFYSPRGQVCVSVHDPWRQISFDLSRSTATLPDHLVSEIEDCVWNARLGEFLDEVRSPPKRFSRPLKGAQWNEQLQEAVHETFAYDERGFCPLCITPFLGERILEINLRGRGGSAATKRIRDLSAAYDPIRKNINNSLAKSRYKGLSYVSLRTTPVSDLTVFQPSFLNRYVESFFAMHRSSASIDWHCTTSQEPASAWRWFDRTHKQSWKADNQGSSGNNLSGLFGNGIDVYSSDPDLQSNETVSAMVELMSVPEVSGVTLYNFGSDIPRDDLGLWHAWNELFGSKLIPLDPKAHTALMSDLPAEWKSKYLRNIGLVDMPSHRHDDDEY